MKKAIINPNICDSSPFCPVVKVCPVNAVKQERISFFKAGVPKVDHEICTGCGKCINYCPQQAVKIINK